MALPAFLEELRARTPLPGLIGRKTRLIRNGRQWKACCPFHNEKTPSFYVYDDHFHCFGCGAHGDAITFLMRAEGAAFPEAVERLAAEAGMEVPKPTPRPRRGNAGRVTSMRCSPRPRPPIAAGCACLKVARRWTT
ncbi:CHC2 zinc finger domain-containing protein [Siccirubricoccus deserti]